MACLSLKRFLFLNLDFRTHISYSSKTLQPITCRYSFGFEQKFLLPIVTSYLFSPSSQKPQHGVLGFGDQVLQHLEVAGTSGEEGCWVNETGPHVRHVQPPKTKKTNPPKKQPGKPQHKENPNLNSNSKPPKPKSTNFHVNEKIGNTSPTKNPKCAFSTPCHSYAF